MEKYSYSKFDGLLIRVGYVDNCLTSLERVYEPGEDQPSDFSEKVFSELHEYFSGTRRSFDIPFKVDGTAFQKKVWKALLDIPYGETRSYRQIAETVGCPKAFRAVGGANHANPICIIIPCHRVVNADGKLGGYDGGLDMKKILLEIERKNYNV